MEQTARGRGGARTGAGRKPGVSTADNPRVIRKAQRYTIMEGELVKRAAEYEGETESEFTRKSAIERAERILGHG